MAKAKELPKGTWKDDGRYYKKCPNPTKNPNCEVTQSYSRLDALKSAITNNRPCSNCGKESVRGLRNPLPKEVWLDEQTGRYCRKCTFCGSIRDYDRWQSARRGVEKKSRCDDCKYDIVHEIKPLPEGAYYVKETKRYFKYCRGCGEKQSYAERRHVLEALENDYHCRVCANKRLSIKRSVVYKDSIRVGWYKDFIIGAKKRKIKWELDIEDVYQIAKFQQFRCMYTGIELTFATDTPKRDATASIDRINSDDHYHKDNICICHKNVNMMKQSLSIDEFIEWCQLVAKTHV
jgi:hypothetical protein